MPEAISWSDKHFHKIANPAEFPSWITVDTLAEFLHHALKPYHDPLPAVRQGLQDALSPDSPIANFVLLAELDRKPTGAVVMLKTRMQAYIPENLLLFIAVDPALRGQGLGRRMLERVIQECDGDVKLHVEYENPAKRLYERVGFVNKYAEMRHVK